MLRAFVECWRESFHLLSVINQKQHQKPKKNDAAVHHQAETTSRTTETVKTSHFNFLVFPGEEEKEVGMDRIISLPPPTPDTFPYQGCFFTRERW